MFKFRGYNINLMFISEETTESKDKIYQLYRKQ